MSENSMNTVEQATENGWQDNQLCCTGEVFALCAPCVHPAGYFYDDFPRLSPQIYHCRMKPPRRPIDESCLPNEATNHPCTT